LADNSPTASQELSGETNQHTESSSRLELKGSVTGANRYNMQAVFYSELIATLRHVDNGEDAMRRKCTAESGETAESDRGPAMIALI
jgi:hypothetical protein